MAGSVTQAVVTHPYVHNMIYYSSLLVGEQYPVQESSSYIAIYFLNLY